MNRRLFILLPLLLVGSCKTTGNEATVSSLLAPTTGKYKEVVHLQDLPVSVKKALGVYSLNPHDRIADSDGKFEAGCTALPGYSNRRLVLAGLADDHVLVVQEKGGFAYQVELLRIGCLHNPARITKRWHLGKRPKSIEEARQLAAVPFPH